MRKFIVITVVAIVLTPVLVCAVLIGNFSGLDKLIDTADAIVILRVDRHVTDFGSPTLRSTHDCYVYQSLKGNIPLNKTIRLQLMDTGTSSVTPYAIGSTHLMFLAKQYGPDVPTDKGVTEQSMETTTERFRIVLSQVIARRLNIPKKDPMVLAHDTREAAARWTAFLREMEPRLPGISSAARNLLNSLVFGLGQMASIEKRLKFSMAGVEAFGRFLVRRMANARAAVLHAGAIAQRRSQIERIVRKLSSGQAKARTIYRDLSIPAADCNDGLLWLEEAAVVRRVDDRWDLVQGARLSFNDCTAPLLEA